MISNIDKVMKIIKYAILLTFGSFLVLIAIFAHHFGLDPNTDWGRGRLILCFLGIFFLVVFMDLRFGVSGTEMVIGRVRAWLIFSREQISDRLNVPARFRHGIEPRTRIGMIYVNAVCAVAIVMASYVWFISAGTWINWPRSSEYYDLLASAFAIGQVSLDVKVSPQLLALADPYDISARDGIGYLWDASFYNGKFYIYWGPAPAVIASGIKYVMPMVIGDNLIVFAAVTGLFIFQTLLMIRIWMRFFQGLPGWTLIIGIFLAGLGIPINWMVHRPEVYEAAILSAQFFIMGGIYFAYRAFEQEKISPRWIALASIFWTGAIASRTIVVMAVMFLVVVVFILILLHHGMRWTSHHRILLLSLGVPIMLGAAALGSYNAARFGSVFDFGLEYQLTKYNYREHEYIFFSSDYILANSYNYFFNPPKKVNRFPYFKAGYGNMTKVFGKQVPESYFAEPVSGLIYSFPFLVFIFMPVRHKIRQVNWVRIILTGVAFMTMLPLFVYFYASMRYYADFMPTLTLLALIGFWNGYQLVFADGFVKLVYSSVALLLAGMSIIVPNLLALLSFPRLNEYSPELLPALNLLYSSIFLR